MKILKNFSGPILLMLLISTNSTYITAQENCSCVICGVPCNAPASAHTNPACPVYKNYHNGGGSSTSVKTSFEQEILLGIFSRALNNLFSNNKPNPDVKSRQEEQNQAALAVLLAKQTRYNDSVAQIEHDRLMKDYKQLDGTAEVKFKTLDDATHNTAVIFSCKILTYKGSVVVFKSNGQSIKLSETQSADLAPGDWIATGNNSRVKLHYSFETGGEDIILGPKSALNIIKDESGRHVPKLLKGEIYVVNNYPEEKLVDGVLDKKEALSKSSDQLVSSVKPFINLRKLEIRTPAAVCAVRGTEFTIKVDEFDNTEVNVKNGIVDLTGNLIQGTITLTAGTMGIVKGIGDILGPFKSDESQFDNYQTRIE